MTRAGNHWDGDAASAVLTAGISLLTGDWISADPRRTRIINKSKSNIIGFLTITNLIALGVITLSGYTGGLFKSSKPQASVVMELGDPYSALNKLVPSFAESSQFLLDFTTHQHNLARLESHIATTELETKDVLRTRLGNARKLSYTIEEEYSEIVERGVTVAYHASAYYTACNGLFKKYEATGKRADKLQYIHAVIQTAEHIAGELNPYYDLLNATHFNLVSLRNETMEIKLLKDYEARKLGLLLHKDKKIQSYQIWGLGSTDFDQMIIEDVHDMCEHNDGFLSNLKRRIDQTHYALKVQIEGLRHLEGKTDSDQDIIGLNQVMVGALNNLKVVMIQMRGHAEMLEKAGNTKVELRKDEGVEVKSEL